MKPFFIEIPNFWVGQTNWANKFGVVWGIFGRTIRTQLSLYIHNLNIHLGLGLEFGPQRILDLAFVCLYSII
jgi:hypothetical protein